MSPAGPAWPRLRVLQTLWALLVVLLAPWRLWAIKNTQECTWQVVLNNFETVGKKDASDRFVDQEPLYTVDKVFSQLVDAPIDPDEVRGLVSGKRERSWTCTPLGSGHLPTLSLQTYLGFPYYLKINYSCKGELFNLIPRYFVNVPSRPLWYTVDQAPVFILGGIPEEKAILLTDTNFKDFFLVELSIDSCWVGSFYCPQTSFTATIYDAIATESTLFIRQNQLIYYFTGTYTTLHESNRGSGRWVRVLANECIKKLCPVHFHSNGSEYVMALTTGKHEGYVHFGTITDGRVSFELLPRQRSVCNGILVVNCSITWAVFIAGDYNLLLLVEIEDPSTRKYFQVVSYDLVSDYLVVLYTIPEFIPDARGLEFLMVLGTESYTNFPMVPKGMSYNPYNNLLFIWGNFLLQSYNSKNFIYLADFPKELSIKYLVNSFYGDTAIVTETEEIWYLLEGSYQVYKLFPSKGWEVHVSLQVMQQSSLYAPNETMVTLFYEDHRLYQLVYLIDNQQGRLVKRLVPVEQLLMYQQISNDYLLERQGSHLTLSFTNFCPFTVMRLRDLPNPQIYTRQERYRAQPPRVLEPGGFHSDNSLAVYQGLVYYLLWLHSKYDKPYADPVHDPTWRWWKNKKQDQDYYFYLASNWRSAGSVHVDMASYEKIYDLKAENELPERIFLDKGTSYRFSVFLTAREPEPLHGPSFQLQSKVGLAVVLADPECIEAVVKEKVLVNRNSVLFWVTLSDKRFCFDQGISGHHLMKTSMLLKVVGSSGHCFQNTNQGPRMQGNLMVPVLIGCPPGKRLAFDITYTLEYNRLQNKHYFDCVHVDPEMPCFLFRDIFYPFFLIQDLVTGDSGSFQGSYVLKVVGGGPTLDTIKEYSEEDIYRFNSPLDKTGSLIWTTRNTTTTEDSAFNILSHNSLGIEWLCMENSPCHDTIPHSIFASEFFFKVLVSNRGVDKSTYCDYQLTFQLRIHGLPLSARRAFLILMVSASLFVGLVILYVISCLLSPYVVKVCNVLCWKINNIIAWESYIYSVASDTGAFSNTSGIKSGESSGGISRVVSKVAGENRTDTKETLRKKPIS
ncbi:cation channel sperm-associated auxiliary subunit gamma isoform X1 [Globicephala melas]|uniref:cation channel sperm-associated auxiliary subunit gamma isoform X1 n=1 Tax=Globicephala melas TaxID=9731 RepID=UPI00293D7EB1|nr:cation channel sperm-associated auxiliary subunit gamma isoform X1 [Globicephala melas]XP_060144872.1 cation channel sperm-associated auxiliary subunit gamma isoform X1 [Globicephala melas]XP_060144873.1 cation channel sperm-associated auxiliary subunit gamma isoform X1 [Globicephala melas]XP_060144874.1 cation channel sperm-associated auxiliary subunit gamma isoform X1 [Globicephala melas]